MHGLLALLLLSLGLSQNVEAAGSAWSYEGRTGPANWPGACKQGKSQSPINIPSLNNIQTSYEPFTFLGYDERPSKASLSNNGHTVQMAFELSSGQDAPMVFGGGLPGTYQFAQFHFHWGSRDNIGSEHTIDNTSYPLEIHFVHFNKKYGDDLGSALAKSKGASDALAVLGVFFAIVDRDNNDIEPIIAALTGAKAKGATAGMLSFPLAEALPRNTDGFYRYQGSLTTPGCNEIVVWTVFKQPIGISAAQMAQFRAVTQGNNKAMVDNFRPTQPLYGRLIEDVETSTKKFSESSASATEIGAVTAILSLVLARFL